ncbi:hypothetical protein ACYQIL_001303 [Acinetobacter baumannii]|uniref:Lipoprotein n=1 Tax=Acinetobacter baumannii (strain SDF) TaxID=509170 RepID=B0VL46_ACIBS|nr:hypothetical protein [Acinetobacter baumannii]ELA7050097.1 hypothetical protein [Acinetobacter baumannii]CAP00796.1 hypothetical protein; putative exported protein [Acinetobacter baumannii SDF]
MKNLVIFLISLAMVGCSHADNSSLKEREAEISKELTSRTLAIGDDIAQSRRLYITAYNTINTKSEMSNELLIYTVRKIDSLIGNYETDKDSFENDINANKKISLEAVDGLCIMNKFLQKYSTLIDLKKAPPSIQESTKRALSYQPLYLKRLSSDKDYLGQLQCINLK